MSAEQYRNELDQLHASPELKARLAALQRETPPAAKPSKLRLAKRAGASVVAAAACLMLCVAVWRGEMLSGKGGFSAAAEHSTQMDEAMMEAAAPESGTETAAAENQEAAAADGAADAPGAEQKTEVANPSAANQRRVVSLRRAAVRRTALRNDGRHDHGGDGQRRDADCGQPGQFWNGWHGVPIWRGRHSGGLSGRGGRLVRI